ncbi:hypothetical protein Poli38472_011012 [Pythium oligandrum]|uniref:protein-histidine N-methyltransferase n=1 Tax=Pythium oligandrum TaxID=41045 RepID=A0A8K1CRI7_PYTOL|nr:hypothetical protein Poli38472_011012 [Pythium oligandrum]|eukprot:TMW67392.1 hypothetical protein Poli38472_011012 [Pythium oligandrum]
MSFSFNFALVAGEDKPQQQDVQVTTSSVTHTRNGERFEWSRPADWATTTEFVPVVIPSSDATMQFEIVNASDAGFIARTGAIGSILTSSDLQTGVYEGGFKLWECALDLVKLMASHEQFKNLRGKRVAELGCGHGLPGIYALQRGADHVAFMDYNKEVLELTTCPNVLRNVREDASLYEKASFYAGAWSSVSDLMGTVEQVPQRDQEFDLIITAETIYTEAVAVELYETIKRHLRRAPGAVALVAAKKYYFGTGGSVQHFMDLVNKDSVFQAHVIWEENDGRSNMRSILQVVPIL